MFYTTCTSFLVRNYFKMKELYKNNQLPHTLFFYDSLVKGVCTISESAAIPGCCMEWMEQAPIVHFLVPKIHLIYCPHIEDISGVKLIKNRYLAKRPRDIYILF